LQVKFSKNGIIKFIEETLDYENPDNKKQPANAKLWEEMLKMGGVKSYLKSGGSKFNDSQPFLRTDSVFNSKFKMNKLVHMVSSPSNLLDYLLFSTLRFTHQNISSSGTQI